MGQGLASNPKPHLLRFLSLIFPLHVCKIISHALLSNVDKVEVFSSHGNEDIRLKFLVIYVIAYHMHTTEGER